MTRVRPASGGHTQLTLRRDRDVLDAIAFGRADLTESVAEGRPGGCRRDARVSRTFGGYESLQLLVRDVAPSGSHPAAQAILAGGSAAATERTGPVDAAEPPAEPGLAVGGLDR